MAHYAPRYRCSFAFVIGIDHYRFAPPLVHAVHDATAIALLLKELFDFSGENLILLVDEAATKANIMASFHSFAGHRVFPNDRVLFY